MKKIIDLTLPIFSGMPIYPGDPKVSIKLLFAYAKGYFISKIVMGSHTGTHIDVPSHMIQDGRTLNDFHISYFYGQATKYTRSLPNVLNPNGEYQVVILEDLELSEKNIDQIITSKFKIVGFGNKPLSINLAKKLLEHNILIVGELTNLKFLPKTFMFSAFPLPLLDGNGSPVRAVAYIE